MSGCVRRVALLALAATAGCGGPDTASPPGPERQPLIVYSTLSDSQTRSLARAYTEATGIPVEYRLGAADELIDNLAAQAYRPGADLLVVAGIRPLARAVDKDVLRPVPAHLSAGLAGPGLRDADGYWTALAVDELLVVTAADAAVADPAGGYVALGDRALRERVCLRGADAEPSVGLIADLVVVLGVRDAEIAVRNWVQNLARPPFGSDAALLDALDTGACGVGIVPGSALARHLADHPASRLTGIAPRDPVVGLSRQVIGAGIGRHANDAPAAAALLSWLLGPEAQRLLAESGPYRPVRGGEGPSGSTGTSRPAASAFAARDAVDLAARAHYPAAAAAP